MFEHIYKKGSGNAGTNSGECLRRSYPSQRDIAAGISSFMSSRMLPKQVIVATIMIHES